VTSKRYLLRTFGCQMNEHDSERIAGMLESDGYLPTTEPAEADVVVLNTCCIRENADNKLYGALGHLKALKADRPDLQIVVGGCLAQKDRELIQQRAGHVDVVFGTHNVHRATELMASARSGGRPVTEIWDEAALDDAEAFPSALPARRETGYAAWLTIQIGCDNACAFCIVPSVRGREISRPIDEIVAEARQLVGAGVTEVTLLGQNVNSYGRDLSLAARRRGEQVRVRPQFATLLRRVGELDGIRRVRFTSPHPKDMTTDVFEAMEATPAVAPHLHFPLQSGSDGVLAAMHGATRPGATWPGWPRQGRRSTTWRSPPTSSSASPVRPRTTSPPPWRWRPRRASTVPTRSCSRPGQVPRRPRWSTGSAIRPRSRTATPGCGP
jgi:tRNA-2-methylthio-N6-dimethylallyladenosine synthase